MVKRTMASISICSLLMACLLALSASFQFNDSDWYFWFPLYASGCIVNLVAGLGMKSPDIIAPLPKFALSMGIFLFVKLVVFEEILWNDQVAGVWSVDMRERVVREKIGTGLVVGSMALQIKRAAAATATGGKGQPEKHFEYGMAVLVGIGYGLSIIFYLYHMKEMRGCEPQDS